MPAPREFLDFVDANADAFIKRLGDAVAIPRYVVSLGSTVLYIIPNVSSA